LGNVTTDVVFSFDPPIKSSSITKVFSWTPGEEKRLEWEYINTTPDTETILTVSYIDEQGIPGQQTFRFSPVQSGAHVMVEITKHEG
jgi:hypothetical protein